MGNRMNTAVNPGITEPMMARGQRDVVNCGGEAVESYIACLPSPSARLSIRSKRFSNSKQKALKPKICVNISQE